MPFGFCTRFCLAGAGRPSGPGHTCRFRARNSRLQFRESGVPRGSLRRELVRMRVSRVPKLPYSNWDRCATDEPCQMQRKAILSRHTTAYLTVIDLSLLPCSPKPQDSSPPLGISLACLKANKKSRRGKLRCPPHHALRPPLLVRSQHPGNDDTVFRHLAGPFGL